MLNFLSVTTHRNLIETHTCHLLDNGRIMADNTCQYTHTGTHTG